MSIHHFQNILSKIENESNFSFSLDKFEQVDEEESKVKEIGFTFNTPVTNTTTTTKTDSGSNNPKTKQTRTKKKSHEMGYLVLKIP